MSVAQLSYDISLLSAAKVRFTNVAAQINNAAAAVEPLGARISSLYNVDESSTPVSIRCANVRRGLVQLVNTINNTVLPVILCLIFCE